MDHLIAQKLTDEQQMLGEEVEQLFAKPLDVRFRSDMPRGMYGQSTVSNDGSPIIELHRGIQAGGPDFRCTFVHEALHLKLRANGWPTEVHVNVGGDPRKYNLDAAGPFCLKIVSHVREEITHAKMFPLMVPVFSDPYRHFRDLLREACAKQIPPPPTSPEVRLRLFEGLVKVPEDKSHRALEKWAKKSRRSSEFKVAHECYQKVVTADLTSADGLENLILELATSIAAGLCTYEFVSKSTTRRGAIDDWQFSFLAELI